MALETYWPSLAIKALRSKLDEALITNIDPSDLARAGSVIIGTLQGNPIRQKIVVEVYENDPDDDSWEHHAATVNRNDDNPTYRDVIGNSRNFWYRRFTLKITVFLRNDTRENAADIRGALVHRIEQVILDIPTIEGLVDDAGERALQGRIVKENGREGGAKDGPFWRSKLWLEFKTIRRR